MTEAQTDSGEPTFTDKLAAEAGPREKPAGSPAMRPFRTLRTREEAALLRVIAPFVSANEDGGDVAAQMLVFDVALDACEMLAVDKAEMELWLEGDGTERGAGLGGAVKLFLWY